MSQGLFTAVSGITTNQSKIDVISDNIANMNTVAFKSSEVNFENIFVRTIGSGSPPGSNIGGTNPLQIGLGATIGEISRNFGGGTVQSTGRSSDLNIQGGGFFTLQDSEGSVVLSRAGNFSLDSDGYLVNPQGLKAIGTSAISSTTGSNTPILIPQSLRLDTSKTLVSGSELLSNLDTKTITPGSFTLTVGTNTASIPVTSSDTLNSIATKINGAAGIGVTAAVDGTTGKMSLSCASTISSVGVTGDTSNFLDITGLSSATPTGTGPYVYKSDALYGNAVSVRPADSSSNTFSLTSFSVGQDGAIEATYANGDKLTVEGTPTRSLLYKTSTGRNIVGSGITVVANATRPEQLQMQMANVINPKGLLSQSGNVFTVGPNSGYANFSIGKSGGMGAINSGGLESSNVDLTSQLSDMILAQNGISANSRSFSTENQIMNILVNLGRG